MEKVTLDRVRQAAETLVMSKPEDYSYHHVVPGWNERTTCFYLMCAPHHPKYGAIGYAKSDKTGPSCIVGVVLWNLGWTWEDLVSLDNRGISAFKSTSWDGPDPRFTDEALDYLLTMQLIQDDGKTWRDAWRVAEEMIGRAERDGED